ncbi:MAG TPA: zf-HC2 domain-containing protein [Terriglobia bacterium]|nr:zf-HC2 domain-containing protein [Terriglobia bacterium]
MNCLSDGQLRAKIDDELSQQELIDLDRHLSSCGRCRQRLGAAAAEAERIGQMLSTLDPADGFAKDSQTALLGFQARQASAPVHAGFRRTLSSVFYAHPFPAWGAAAMTTLIVILAVFAPARSLAQRVLDMLRVQRVAVVPVSLSAMPGRNTVETVSRILSDQVVVTLSPGKPQAVASASQASQLAGFQVRMLTGQSEAPQIFVQGERAFVMTLNQSRLQEVLSALGRPDLEIPPSVDGSTIAVHIPKAVYVQYGNCPHHTSQGGPPQASAAMGCTAIVQVPSPTVSVPPGLNIDQLAEIALQAAGMTAEEAEAFCQTVDWSSTLVVPIPSGVTSSMQVSVDGVEGTLITHTPRNGHPAGYDLIWVKNGIMYSIWGFGSAESALGVAGSLS